MPKDKKQEAIQLFKLLDKQGVWYLDFDNYNDEESNELPANFKMIYNRLFNLLIQPALDKFPKDVQDTMIFNFFGKENGKWYAAWYEPEVEMSIDDLTDGKLLATLMNK